MLKAIRNTLLVLVITGVLAAVAGWQWLEQYGQQVLSLEQQQTLTVKRGTSVNALGQQLADAGWLKEPRWLRVWIRLNPELAGIRAGTYALEPGMQLQQVLELLVSGREHLYQITLVEGSQFREWRKALAAHAHIDQQLTDLSNEAILAKVAAEFDHPEGAFFPDTYNFAAGTSDLEILRRAHQAMLKNLAASWATRQEELPYDTPYEALIMASIVEKETGQAYERPMVAGVFVNRLRKGMRLQTDPTVIYGLGENYSGRLRKKDLRTDTPYNTYTRHGLPPTPIAMPGRAALDAATQPEATEYIYFVSRKDGSHHFSRTLQEHNRAVRKYILGKN